MWIIATIKTSQQWNPLAVFDSVKHWNHTYCLVAQIRHSWEKDYLFSNERLVQIVFWCCASKVDNNDVKESRETGCFIYCRNSILTRKDLMQSLSLHMYQFNQVLTSCCVALLNNKLVMWRAGTDVWEAEPVLDGPLLLHMWTPRADGVHARHLPRCPPAAFFEWHWQWLTFLGYTRWMTNVSFVGDGDLAASTAGHRNCKGKKQASNASWWQFLMAIYMDFSAPYPISDQVAAFVKLWRDQSMKDITRDE